MRRSPSGTHAVASTPAESLVYMLLMTPEMAAFPEILAGQLLHWAFRGLLSVHSRYGLRTRQVTFMTLYTRGFSRFVTSTTAPVATGWSNSCRVGSRPRRDRAFFQAHKISAHGTRVTPCLRRLRAGPAHGPRRTAALRGGGTTGWGCDRSEGGVHRCVLMLCPEALFLIKNCLTTRAHPAGSATYRVKIRSY